MPICHTHNLVQIRAGKKPWGLRLTLPAGDAFSGILGDFESVEWYTTEREREEAIRTLRGHFPYYRGGDRPTYVVERLDPPANDAREDSAAP